MATLNNEYILNMLLFKAQQMMNSGVNKEGELTACLSTSNSQALLSPMGQVLDPRWLLYLYRLQQTMPLSLQVWQALACGQAGGSKIFNPLAKTNNYILNQTSNLSQSNSGTMGQLSSTYNLNSSNTALFTNADMSEKENSIFYILINLY